MNDWRTIGVLAVELKIAALVPVDPDHIALSPRGLTYSPAAVEFIVERLARVGVSVVERDL